MSNNTILLTGSERDAYIAERFQPTELEVASHDAEEIMQAEADMQQRISELFDIDNIAKVDTIIQELEGYGIDTEENLDDAYSGCYRDEATFCEDLLSDCYSEAIDAMPVFLQTAIDWEMVWHQSMQYDYFAIYHNCEYYFFNRNF
jgi:hypothetical protein